MNFQKSLFLVLLAASNFAPQHALAFELKFLSAQNIAPLTQFQNAPLGGLSGISYDAASKTLFAISDDKSEFAPARFYSFSLGTQGAGFELMPTQFTILKNAGNQPFPLKGIDPEGIAFLSNKRIFVSSEGNSRSTPRVWPAVFEFDQHGSEKRSLHIPDKFLPEFTGEQTKGIYDNGAFESLTIAPSHKYLITATEDPLLQDDTPATFEKGARVRILRYELTANGARVPEQEFAYDVEKTFKPENSDGIEDGGNGVSDMLALNDSTYLVMERGGTIANEVYTTHVRLFKVSVQQATDVSKLESLKDQKIVPAQKELIFDFDSIVPQLSSPYQTIDNLEGLTFGPMLPNGHKTLLFISDDNFNKTQRTQFLSFEILENSLNSKN